MAKPRSGTNAKQVDPSEAGWDLLRQQAADFAAAKDPNRLNPTNSSTADIAASIRREREVTAAWKALRPAVKSVVKSYNKAAKKNRVESLKIVESNSERTLVISRPPLEHWEFRIVAGSGDIFYLLKNRSSGSPEQAKVGPDLKNLKQLQAELKQFLEDV